MEKQYKVTLNNKVVLADESPVTQALIKIMTGRNESAIEMQNAVTALCNSAFKDKPENDVFVLSKNKDGQYTPKKMITRKDIIKAGNIIKVNSDKIAKLKAEIESAINVQDILTKTVSVKTFTITDETPVY